MPTCQVPRETWIAALEERCVSLQNRPPEERSLEAVVRALISSLAAGAGGMLSPTVCAWLQGIAEQARR